MNAQTNPRPEDVLAAAQALRWEVGGDFHEKLMEAIYADAAQIADRAVTRPGEKPRFDLDRAIDRVVTSRVWGFPLMITSPLSGGVTPKIVMAVSVRPEPTMPKNPRISPRWSWKLTS